MAVCKSSHILVTFLVIFGFSFTHGASNCGISRVSKLTDPAKVWWAKRLTPDVYASGRLSERQVKYAVDAGFRSMLMVWTFPKPGRFGDEVLPNVTRVRYLVTELGGLQFDTVYQQSDLKQYPSNHTLERFGPKFERLQRPVLVTCFTAGSASLFVLSYMNRQNTGLSLDRLLHLSSVHGFNFNTPSYRRYLTALTNTTMPVKLTTPADVSAKELKHWWVQPIYRNWHSSGQIQVSHMKEVHASGIKTIINLRLGTVTRGKPSQEETFLINIKSKTGTYTGGGRQNTGRLEQSRINSRQRNEYISSSSRINYESYNQYEFGDDVGYNETLERLAVEELSESDYIHLPFTCNHLSSDWFGTHKERLLDASRKGPVLLHCGSGFRTAYMAVLGAAYEHSLGLDWAVTRLADLGYAMKEGSLGHKWYVKWLNEATPPTLDACAGNIAASISNIAIHVVTMPLIISAVKRAYFYF